MLMTKDELLENLKENGPNILDQAKDMLCDYFKRQAAIEIIKWYEMWYRCPGDNIAFVMVEQHYREWLTFK